jgi:hypothetical protein
MLGFWLFYFESGDETTVDHEEIHIHDPSRPECFWSSGVAGTFQVLPRRSWATQQWLPNVVVSSKIGFSVYRNGWCQSPVYWTLLDSRTHYINKQGPFAGFQFQ